MRFMMIVKADRNTETGALPAERDIAAMGKFNEEMMKAGVFVDAAGLRPSSKGAKVTWSNGKVQVVDGPFAETKELIGGFWVIRVKSRAEAIEWAKRIPFTHLPSTGRDPEIEIREFYEPEDFARDIAAGGSR